MSKNLYKAFLEEKLNTLTTQHQIAMRNFNQAQQLLDQTRIAAVKLEGQIESIQGQLQEVATKPVEDFKFLQSEKTKK